LGKVGRKLGNGRGNDIKTQQDRNVQKCSVYTDLIGYRKILQRDVHKGYATDFFDFPSFPYAFETGEKIE